MKWIWPAILLAWIAGFVDALGYLALSKVFTAHMSGNAAAVGAQLGVGNWHEAMIRGLAIPGFMFGISLGVLSEAATRRLSGQTVLAPAFLLEIIFLFSFALLEPQSAAARPAPGTLGFFLRVWLLASAMGLQSATLRRVGGTRVRTTYVTGMLTNTVENATRYLLQRCCPPAHAQNPDSPSRHTLGRRAALFGLIFLSFLVGGICGGLGEVRWGPLALLVTIPGLLIVALEDWLTRRRR